RHQALLIVLEIPQHSSISCHAPERSLTPPRSDERRRAETSRAEGGRGAKRRGRPRRGRRREAARGGPRWRQAREGETSTRVLFNHTESRLNAVPWTDLFFTLRLWECSILLLAQFRVCRHCARNPVITVAVSCCGFRTTT